MPKVEGTVTVKEFLSRIRLWMRVFGGKVYNLAGIPGIVRDCDYSASAYDARIKVRSKELFTIITVNGLDIYFHRLTGTIDGVGFGVTSNYSLETVRESAQIPDPFSLPRHTFRKRNQ